MNFPIFLWLLLFQISPNFEYQLAEKVIIHYLESMPAHNQDGKFFVSEVLDSVYVKRYQRVLNPQNELVYKGLTMDQKELVQDLLKLRNPAAFDVKELIEQEKFKIRPLKEIDRKDWEPSSIKVSRVAFSPNRNEACLILEYVCGNKCGEGLLIFVRKENEDWKVVQRKMLWVA